MARAGVCGKGLVADLLAKVEASLRAPITAEGRVEAEPQGDPGMGPLAGFEPATSDLVSRG